MNKLFKRRLNDMFDNVFDYWGHLQAEYKVPTDLYIPFTVYTTRFYEPHKDGQIQYIRECKWSSDGVMTTVFNIRGENIHENFEDNIIKEIHADTYMSYQSLYETILNCDSSFYQAEKCLKFYLRHELGHVLSKRERYTGKTVKEWNQSTDDHDKLMMSLPKLRKNASDQNRLKWLLDYHQLPEEKLANEKMGITEDDIIKDFIRTGGQVKR